LDDKRAQLTWAADLEQDFIVSKKATITHPIGRATVTWLQSTRDPHPMGVRESITSESKAKGARMHQTKTKQERQWEAKT
ncbi:hypothetical protein SERLADRAFT_378803, partial [Serpula lacrymans var. lacrymans S7.9]